MTKTIAQTQWTVETFGGNHGGPLFYVSRTGAYGMPEFLCHGGIKNSSFCCPESFYLTQADAEKSINEYFARVGL